MNYRDARKLYFEDYVDFENLVFGLLDVYKSLKFKTSTYTKRTEGQKLSDAISDLCNLAGPDLRGINLGYHKLIKYKGYRNDLAHKHGSIAVSKGIVSNLPAITSINKLLKDLLSAMESNKK